MQDPLNNLKWQDYAFLGMNPQAMGLLQTILGVRQHQEDRRLATEDRRRAAEDREYNRARQQRLDEEAARDRQGLRERQEFDDDQQIAAAGGERITNVGELWFSKNKGNVVRRRKGELVRFKSDGQKREEALATYKAQKQAEAEVELENSEEIPIPEEMGGGTARVPKSKKLDKIIDMHKARFPNLTISTQADNDGNVTVVATDPRTGEVMKQTNLGPIGKSKEEPMATATELRAVAENNVLGKFKQRFPNYLRESDEYLSAVQEVMRLTRANEADARKYLGELASERKQKEVIGEYPEFFERFRRAQQNQFIDVRKTPEYESAINQELITLMQQQRANRKTSPRKGPNAAVNEKAAKQTEDEYIANYDKLTPAQRKQLEESFKTEFGREIRRR